MAYTLIKNTLAWRDFSREIEKGLSHAYLLVTPDTLAAHEIFRLIAETAMSRGRERAAEVAKIEAESHPDVRFYENAGKMNVKDAEELIESTMMKSAEGGKKLYFLERADGMSQSVQNKLLKTYEEPPKNVTIFVSASSETALLATIRSRAKKFFLEAFSEEALEEELLSLDTEEETAKTIAMTAAGSYTDAIRFASDDKFVTLYRDAFQLLVQLKKSADIPSVVGSPLFRKENIAETLNFFERIVWDAERVRLQLCRGGTTPGDTLDLQEIGAGISPAAAAVVSDKINIARKKLSINLSPQTVAETLLFGILEAKYQWQS